MKNDKYLSIQDNDMLKTSYINHKHFKTSFFFLNAIKKVKAILMHYNE